MDQPRMAPEAPKTPLQKIREAVETRINMLRNSERVLAQHNVNLDSYGYEPRIDELESFLHFLETEIGRTS